MSTLVAASGPVKKKLHSVVGIANVPNQVHRKSVKRGFNFTAIVVGMLELGGGPLDNGESGLGKSTLVNTLFQAPLYPPKEEVAELSADLPQTVAIQAVSADIEENGVRLTLTVVDTPGFGDFVNNERSWQPILDNIEQRFDAYLEQENRVNRKKIVDNRVHACLYFIAPTGHSLKPLDIEFMRRLHQRVNLVPVIAKSDALTHEELAAFKRRILEELEQHGIRVFRPDKSEYDDAETLEETEHILKRIPFAVVGSTKEVDAGNGRMVRGRKYPWGVIEVDNESHCDFVTLRQMLIRTHMEDLKEITNNVIYEQYRTEKLSKSDYNVDSNGEINPLLKFEEERAAHEAKMVKLEAEMKHVFQLKVAEKEAKMRQNEEELYAKHRELRESIEKQRVELEEKKRKLEGGDKKKMKSLFK